MSRKSGTLKATSSLRRNAPAYPMSSSARSRTSQRSELLEHGGDHLGAGRRLLRARDPVRALDAAPDGLHLRRLRRDRVTAEAVKGAQRVEPSLERCDSLLTGTVGEVCRDGGRGRRDRLGDAVPGARGRDTTASR